MNSETALVIILFFQQKEFSRHGCILTCIELKSFLKVCQLYLLHFFSLWIIYEVEGGHCNQLNFSFVALMHWVVPLTSTSLLMASNDPMREFLYLKNSAHVSVSFWVFFSIIWNITLTCNYWKDLVNNFWVLPSAALLCMWCISGSLFCCFLRAVNLLCTFLLLRRGSEFKMQNFKM